MRKLFGLLFMGGALALCAYALISAGEWDFGYPSNPGLQEGTVIETTVRATPRQPSNATLKLSIPITKAGLQVPVSGTSSTKISNYAAYSDVAAKLPMLPNIDPASLKLLYGAKIKSAISAVQADESETR